MADVQIAEVLVSVALDPNSPLQAQAQKLIRQLEAEGKRMEQTLGGAADRALGQLAAAGKRVASSLTSAFGAVSASLAGIAATSLVTGANFNNLQAKSRKALTTILKGSKEAEAVLRDVNALVDESPFARPIFLEATQQLLAFGLEAKKVVPVLDAAQQAVAAFGGSGADLQQIIGVFSRISSQGRITGDDLRSLQLQGVEAAELIGAQFGKTGEQIRDEVSKGAIDAATAIDALTTGIQDRFGGATEGLRATFDGAKDRLQAALRDIGANLTSTLISPTGAAGGGFLVEAINNIATGLRNIQKTIVPQLIPAFTAIGKVLANATAAFANFTETLKENEGGISKVLDLMKAFAPVAALAGAAAFQSFSRNIPVLAGFSTALNGPLIALALFAATNDDVRAAVTGLIEALQPAISRILPTLLVIFEQLSEIVGSVAGRIISSLTPAIVTLAETFSRVLTALVPVLDLLAKLTPVITPLVFGFLAFKGVSLIMLATSAALTRMAGAALLAGKAFTTATTKLGIFSAATAKVQKGAALASSRFALLAGTVGKFAGPIGIAASIGIPLLVQAFSNAEKAAVPLETRLNNLSTALEGVTSKAAAAQIVIDELFTPEQKETLNLGDLGLDKLNKDAAEAEKIINDIVKEIGAADTQDITSLELVEGSEDNLGDVSAALRENSELLEVYEKAKKTVEDANINLLASEEAVTAAATKGNQAQIKAAIIASTSGRQQASLLKALEKGIALNKAAATTTDEFAEANKKAYGSVAALADQIKAVDELNDRLQALATAQLAVATATGAAKDAQEDLNDAIADSKNAVADRNELQAEYAALLADTTMDIKELTDAEEDLLGIRRSLRDLDQTRLDLLEQLAELNTPADADDIVSAQDKITKSQIAYNQLLREQAAEEDALTPKTKKRLNLQGLSLDEVRSNLRNVREALAAQKDGADDEKKQKDDFLTVDEKRILAEIAVRDAAQEVTDAKETLLNLQNQVLDNSEEILDIEQQIVDLDEDRIGILRDEETALISINSIRSGDTERAKTLKGLEEDIATANERVATAAERVQDAKEKTATAVGAIQTAEEAIALARATAIGDEGEILRLKKLQTDELFAQLNIRDAFNKQAATALFTAFASTFAPAGPEGAQQRQFSSLNKATNLLNNPNFIAQLSEALLKDPASDLRTVLKELFRRAGIILPGFKEGGLVTGSGSFGTLIRAGEYGKTEGIVPFSNTANTLSTLQSGLKYMTPQLQSILGPSLGMGSAQPMLSLSGSHGGANYNADRIGPGERELLDLLRDIRDGVSNNSGQVNHFEINAQSSDPNMVVRKVSREIQRKLDRL